ncbi:bifunctional DNA-formamidopyrimidine glycosylase/DNA-(apurinic or apyrimidinic site) lyase [Halothermothrix orenii]|uniref:Formamidopyrimidine-DNA glycosylase n=1 Tax=Halothermothrix orenii (strain H 168 / OCM 544 / DSM 9562) TaxID=373903 RepID=B8D218_HALOH|nr:bifunctional DNA-formamidopyrimidine glycosylase/DNA-(apurinic or apyrimidinic site) lyase [Halothermothrix orenii]ACL69245.1 formamidopyrimidine-DNA glycosylase [Halothermothrix orenii H 168]
MPELPEVETVVRGLKELIKGVKINKVIIRETKLLVYPDPDTFIDLVEGSRVIDVLRRGKYILIKLDNNRFLVFHLKMTGQLVVYERNNKYDKHTHFVFELEDGRDLRFNNMRKFGRVYLVTKGEFDKAGSLADLGPEPLSDEFTVDEFADIIKRRKGNIKGLLLNQKFIAGLGNIYADEALFEAGISPERKADSLDDSEIERLYHAIRKVLKMGIKYGGTSMKDYVNARGRIGEFQNKLKVYRKTGEECVNCGHEIQKKVIRGRSSHYCPGCQK